MSSNIKCRTDLLNFLAEEYKLQRYLEIGVQVPELNFHKVSCPSKVGVDPVIVPEYRMVDGCGYNLFTTTSDNYFASLDGDGDKFDLIFIDGLHTAEQVKKDFENALKVLSPRGFIVLHDCNPILEEHTIVPRPTERGHWNGNVYKFACQLALNWMSYRTVDIDNGCGVYFNSTPIVEYGDAPTWERFEPRRKELLNLITWEEFIKL